MESGSDLCCTSVFFVLVVEVDLFAFASPKTKHANKKSRLHHGKVDCKAQKCHQRGRGFDHCSVSSSALRMPRTYAPHQYKVICGVSGRAEPCCLPVNAHRRGQHSSLWASTPRAGSAHGQLKWAMPWMLPVASPAVLCPDTLFYGGRRGTTDNASSKSSKYHHSKLLRQSLIRYGWSFFCVWLISY